MFKNNRLGANAGIVREFWHKSHFSLGVNYEFNETIREPGTLLGPENEAALNGVFGLDDINLVEAIAELDIDFRDRPNIPENSARLFLGFNSGIVTNNDNSNYGIVHGFLEQYINFQRFVPATLGLKLGGSTTYGEENLVFILIDSE